MVNHVALFLVWGVNHAPGFPRTPVQAEPSQVPAFSHQSYSSGEEEKPGGGGGGGKTGAPPAPGHWLQGQPGAQKRLALPPWTYRAADRGVRGSAPAAAGKGLGVGPCGQVGSWRCTTPSPGAEGRSQNLRTGRAVFPATAPGRWTPSLSLASLSSKAEILAGLMGPFEGAHGPKQDSSLEQSLARGQNPRASHTSGLSGSHSVTGSHPAATGCCGDSQSAPRVPLGLQSS